MKRIRITHHSRYFYRKPVVFDLHRAMLRPREGHDVHIAASRLEISPSATVRWLRDIYAIRSRFSHLENPPGSCRC
ncbi:MAG TPA: transglutaminase N-terminal domain-containing protein [Terrimicrobiaceae bacterium]